MTAPARLTLARTGEAADLAAFLGRLIRWDKAAAVRLRSAEGEAALGVFGHPPFGGVLAVRTAALAGDGVGAAVDATVSAGQLLDAADACVVDGGELALPGSVTGPSWAGLLPPRGGWVRVAEADIDEVRAVAARVIGEFRTRTEALGEGGRTRVALDALAEELWGRVLPGTALPLRAVHAAHALGFLRGEEAVLLGAGPWLRLRTAAGSVAVRAASPAAGLTVTPA
ncbi:hypothetical protein SAMN05216251_11647 [Actinacidiphila alni]|uniref:Uncharacterized protein n=1 Tax=Actinacidiphila alni TaxID=380248 RepID=A0A1I2J587_9ACTN|nr:hypothetical protein [Actinacidiphila alni]SFF49170.1 hypothetical protein SAMN05216251_11647 [Actinacidiphila alni]